MNPDPNDSIDELLILEGKFQDDYKKMNKYILLFKKIRKIINSYPKITGLQINLSREKTAILSILPFSFIISIKFRQYLLYLNVDPSISISLNDLKEYNKLFSEYPFVWGSILVWNDEKLSSILLNATDLHGPLEGVLNSIKTSIQPFREILDVIIDTSNIANSVIKPEREEQTEKKQLNLINEFEKALNGSFDRFKSKRFRGKKQELFNTISDKNLEKIKTLFSDFFMNRISSDDLRKKFNNYLKRLVK